MADVSEIARIKQAMADGEHTDGDLAYAVEQWEAATLKLIDCEGAGRHVLGRLKEAESRLDTLVKAADTWRDSCQDEIRLRKAAERRLDALESAVRAAWDARREGDMWKALGAAMDLVETAVETQAPRSRVEEQNRYLRNWIRELRDTQESRGYGAADPLYSMLLDRIDPLMKADPAADSAEGIRLVALAELCEAYEKRVVERLEPK